LLCSFELVDFVHFVSFVRGCRPRPVFFVLFSLSLLLLYTCGQPPRWMSLVWKDLRLTGHLVLANGTLPKSLPVNGLQHWQIARNNLKVFQIFLSRYYQRTYVAAPGPRSP
jgi:hypothetical protein